MRRVLIVPVLSLGLLAVGCGDSGETTTSDATTSKPATAAAPEPTPTLIHAAEQVVLDELPDDVPIWKGATVKGVGTADGDICVERFYAKPPSFSNGRSAGFVIVSIPSMATSEPKDGTCEKAAPDPNKRLSSDELDSLATGLLSTIENGDDSAIVAEAEKVKRTLDEPIPMTTYNANLIHSATAVVIEGVEDDLPEQIETGKEYLEEVLDRLD